MSTSISTAPTADSGDGWVYDGPVRVMFDFIGEGYNGDFDESDPGDAALLRLDMGVSVASGYGGELTDDPGWLYPDQGSICTSVLYDTPVDRQRQILVLAAAVLRKTVEAGESVKRTMDRLSRWTAQDTSL